MNSRSTLVTVVGPGGRRDLSLPVDAPIKELVPPLVDLTGDQSNGSSGHPGKWTLSRSAGDALSPGSSLAEQGVLEGTVLYLAPVRTDGPRSEPPPVAPPYDGLTPAERMKALFPPDLSVLQRIRLVLKVMFARPPAAGARPHGAVPAPSNEANAALAKPTPAGLTVDRPPPGLERGRRAWRESDYVEQLCAMMTAPRLGRCATIAVVSPKGGVGKTTITALIGTLLSLLGRDRIVAVDTNPDYGSLGRVLAPDNQLFVDDVLASLDRPDLTLTELDAQLARAAHGLLVLPAPTDPERMAQLDEEAYSRLVERLKEYVGIVVLDCGTGLQDPASRAAIKAADQLLLVTDDQPAAASLVAEAGTLLVRSGRPITLVVNKMPARGSMLDVELLARYLPQARGLVMIPRELDAASALALGNFDWRNAPRSWQRACSELVVALVSDWRRLGLAL